MGSASGESSTSGESSDQVPPMVMTSPASKLQRPHAGLRILGTLGKGAFGTVSKCVWKGRVLAMKVVKRVRTAERELSIHRHLQQAPFRAEIAHLKACRKMPSGEYRFWFEAFASDLREYLCQKRAHAAPIAAQQAMRFALDLSSGLAHLHGTHVAHRELKPGNVLLRLREPFHACLPVAAKTKVSAGQQSDSSVLWQAVIGDFGNSAVLKHPLAMETRRGLQATQLRGERQALTRRVATLWYAAPELLVPGERYDFSLDLWAFGVVLLEIERKLPVCATCAGAADWTQLWHCWRLRQPVAAKGSFAERALQEMRRHDLFPLTRVDLARHDNYQPGAHYGTRFRQYCWSALSFEAGERIKARDLWRNSSTSLALHVVLPPYWILD
jgi:serine/threonine protein kinase